MNRVPAALGLVVLTVGVGHIAADEPPKKLTAEERKELETRWKELNSAGMKAFAAGKREEATEAANRVLDIARRLYPKDEFPDGHANLATSLNNLAFVLQDGDKLAEAEVLSREALDMRKRLFKGDHPAVALSTGNLAALLEARGKLAEAEGLHRESLDMRKRLFTGDHPAVAASTNNLASCLQEQGRLTDAEPLYRAALDMRSRLFKGDHPELASSLNNLAFLHHAQGRLADAELRYREALAMYRRLFKGDHPDLALSLNNLAGLLQDQGKFTEAERLYREALAMNKGLYKGHHPDVAMNLNNLAAVLRFQGKFADAEPMLREARDITRALYKGDHPHLATGLNNQAILLAAQGKRSEAEVLYKQALAMRQRLFKGDHPLVALSLNNLGRVLEDRGRVADAEPLLREALAMRQRLYKGDHPDVLQSLTNVACVVGERGKPADAGPFLREALAMNRRLLAAYAVRKTEGEALTLFASTPLTRDRFLSNAREREADPVTVYPEVWASKAAVARIYEHRQQTARAAATDPQAATMLAELADTRRRRAELILAPEARDPLTRQKREDQIKAFDQTITDLDRAIRPLLPTIERAEKLAKATPADLQKALPADAAVADFLRYLHIEYDPARPGEDGEKVTPSYLAFVVTRDRIVWIDLGAAEPIESAVGTWRDAITSGKDIPAAVPVKVRELVWEKVRKALPPGAKTVYVAPDMALSRVPWAALPGDKPGTILLEDVAIATIPHGTFLLDQLWPQDERKNPPAGVLIVGGVDYEAEPAAGQPVNRDLPVKPGTKAAWPNLPGAAAEATGVAGAAAKKKLAVTPLRSEKATAAAVLSELPKARYAHLATHGFFADASFRSVFQLDPKQFEMTRRGERVGAGALSPLVMTGLVLAGANNPKTPGRGIITGESLVDLDLSGLELAVLSACETGLGDVAGGEGTFGLQRAFHLAGTRNVVASLWKVPDQPTAALMALFYQKLWEKGLSPLAALREAQLEIYRNPGKIAALAEGFRGKFDVVPGAADIKPTADGKAHPRLWAAFTLSGPG